MTIWDKRQEEIRRKGLELVKMWKEDLPENCPPENAKELDIEAYRMIRNKKPQLSDFVPYIHQFPENRRYKKLCKAYALSFHDTRENAIKAIEKMKERRSSNLRYVAKFRIMEDDGVNEMNSFNGHISTWLYESKSYDVFLSRHLKESDES